MLSLSPASRHPGKTASSQTCVLRNACLLLLPLLLLLNGCTSLPVPGNPDWDRHATANSTIDNWALRGRLNIRQNKKSETISLNWVQNQENFSIQLSGSFGLGGVEISGNNALVKLEQAGNEAVYLPNLDSVASDYLGYDFPTAYLQHWVLGLPVPELPERHTLNENQHLATLSQQLPEGQEWSLEFDRYTQAQGYFLPGRIRLQHEDIRLIFLISDWSVSSPSQPDKG